MGETRRWFFFPWPLRRRGEPPAAPQEHPMAATERLMLDTLAAAPRACDPLLDIVGHCTRVASLARWLATELGVAPEHRELLALAARLHEIGMIAVPPQLLDTPERLTAGELERVRAQAWIGASIVRLKHGPRAAALVEHQYSDYRELRDSFAGDGVDLLLASILRVADVFDAMCYPRPYQERPSDAFRSEVLRAGAGTRFHPGVTRLMLRHDP